jgi:hypothetical protein
VPVAGFGGMKFRDAQARRFAARWPTILRWPSAARRDKPQNRILECNLDVMRGEAQVPTVSSSHSVAVLEVVEAAFRNDFDLVLYIGADLLQRERFLAIASHD